MKNSQLVGLSLFAVVSFAAACSDTGAPTGIAAPEMRPRTAVIPIQSGGQVCSTNLGDVDGKWKELIPPNPNWAAAVNYPDGRWVGYIDPLFPDPAVDFARKSLRQYKSTFDVPANAINVAIVGRILVDNDALINVNGNLRFFSTFQLDGLADFPGNVYPIGLPDDRTINNFKVGWPFSTSANFVAGTNYVNFLVYNDDNKNFGEGDVNPSGLSFCYTVTYELAPPQVGQGCSPGYWKNHNFPAGYIKTQKFNSDILGADPDFANAFPGKSFQDVLSAGGGGLTALGRATVSAFFNAVTLGANYGLTPQQVVSMFNAAYASGNYNGLKDTFEALQDVNGRRCPNPTGN